MKALVGDLIRRVTKKCASAVEIKHFTTHRAAEKLNHWKKTVRLNCCNGVYHSSDKHCISAWWSAYCVSRHNGLLVRPNRKIHDRWHLSTSLKFGVKPTACSLPLWCPSTGGNPVGWCAAILRTTVPVYAATESSWIFLIDWHPSRDGWFFLLLWLVQLSFSTLVF